MSPRSMLVNASFAMLIADTKCRGYGLMDGGRGPNMPGYGLLRGVRFTLLFNVEESRIFQSNEILSCIRFRNARVVDVQKRAG